MKILKFFLQSNTNKTFNKLMFVHITQPQLENFTVLNK